MSAIIINAYIYVDWEIFFKNFPKIPGSIAMKILSKFIIEQQNGTQIKNYLKFNLELNINISTVNKILK